MQLFNFNVFLESQGWRYKVRLRTYSRRQSDAYWRSGCVIDHRSTKSGIADGHTGSLMLHTYEFISANQKDYDIRRILIGRIT